MSYKWTTGEKITAQKLNTTGNVLIIHATEDSDTGATILDKTWQEIYDAPYSVFVSGGESLGDGYEYYPIRNAYMGVNEYIVQFGISNIATTYTTDSANGYPSHGGGAPK